MPRQLISPLSKMTPTASRASATICTATADLFFNTFPNPLSMPYSLIITGPIQKGAGRGKQLGYPTINIDVTSATIQSDIDTKRVLATADLSDGIYISEAFIDNHWQPSLAFIGTPTMFGESVRRLEVYLLESIDTIAAKELSVRLLKKLRNSQNFTTTEELIEQMNLDLAAAQTYFAHKVADDPAL